VTFDMQRTQEQLVAALIRCPALALPVHSQLARRQAWVAETDSAANHYGQLRAEDPRHHLRFLWPVSAPRICRISG